MPGKNICDYIRAIAEGAKTICDRLTGKDDDDD
jgi:hypothetical protein